MKNDRIKMKNLETCRWFQLLLGFLFLGFIHSDCLFPTEDIENGRYKFLKSSDATSPVAPEMYLLRFECEQGYEMIGTKMIQCIDETWTDDLPFCEARQCSDPPKIANGTYIIRGEDSTELTIGTQVTYSCSPGLELSDPEHSNMTCILNEDGDETLWAGELPVCGEIKPCFDPKMSANGTREGDCCLPGSVLRYSCNAGFELIGNKEIECLQSKKWSSRRPLCKPSVEHCTLPPEIPHGMVIGGSGDYFYPEEEAQIKCEPGFKLVGESEYPYCNKSAMWEAEFGECIEINCEQPEPLGNGTILELEQMESNATLPHKFELTYVCKDGYRLVGGDSWRICEKNGWSGDVPHCEEILCPDPGRPEHGSREGDSFKVGEKVRFKCFTGYDLLGSIERYCRPNGKWSGDLARCDAPSNYCPNPGVPINGLKHGDNYDEGDLVKFRCRTGYIQSGSEFRVCMPDGTWNGTETKCLGPYDYDDTKDVSETMKMRLMEKFDDELSEWRKLQFAKGMSPNRDLDLNYDGTLIIYFAFDVSGSVGIGNFKKGIEFAKAIVKKVGIKKDGARAGALVFSNTPENKFIPGNLDLETTEDVLEQLDAIEYTGGGTAASSALAKMIGNVVLDNEIFAEKKDRKTILFLITDGKANMGGSPDQEAETLKKMNVEIFCIGITGDVRMDTMYKIASTSKYGNEERPNVFILKNYAALPYLVQDITNGTIDYSQCGLGMEKILSASSGKILGGKVSSDPWPWMAALYFDDPSKRLKKAELKCGGSIISRRFILTAAHCLFRQDKRKNEYHKRNKEDIIVKLGMVDIKNETLVQDFGVKRIYIHEKYVHNGHFFDYDIALLEIDRPAIYSPFVRPICLPPKVLPEKTTLYKPKQYGWVIGWGHTSKVRPNDMNTDFKVSRTLKELSMPIQPNERCVKSLIENGHKGEKLFTERMYCAGDGESGNDTCKGDSGGPFMQSLMNAEGYVYWTQVGIVSWGIGCGMKAHYGYYTNIQQLRPWIDEKVNMQHDIED